MADFPAVIRLRALDGTDGFRVTGESAGRESGSSVALAGDVNGDGLDDIIIGAPGNGGSGYVVFGKADGFAARITLAALGGDNGFRFDGATFGYAGSSVASAGDINGDGFDDIIVGAPFTDLSSYGEGASYVVFGTDQRFTASLDAADLDGSNGFRLDGIDPGDNSGWSVASAGDVNGDGLDDIVIGARSSYADESYVVFGANQGFAASVDLADLDGSNGFRITGSDRYDSIGYSVASAGDVNGDGFDDIIIGAPYGDVDSYTEGESYVVFGSDQGFAASLDLESLDGSNGFRLDGIDYYDRSGTSVASAGDVNGDGLDDLIVGAYGGDANQNSYAGESYVVFGRSDGFSAVIRLESLDGSNGFRLDGIDKFDWSGRSVASAGDVNGDGFDDLIVGAPRAELDESYQGESYVVFGKSGGFSADFDLEDLDGSNGFRLQGLNSQDRSGYSVASAGDVNGDGFDDIIIGAPYAEAGRGDDAGHSYVVFGRAPSEAANRVGAAGDQAIRGGDFDDTLSGKGGDDTLTGAAGDDVLRGGGGADLLQGGVGHDRLVASLGRDALKGEGGRDVFVLDDEAADKNRVTIRDFAGGKDRIEIDADDFGSGLVAGPLDPDAFIANATGMAEDAEDRFIYDIDAGKLFFDADGTGAGGRELIAVLSGAPGLGATDFEVVDGGAASARWFAAATEPNSEAQSFEPAASERAGGGGCAEMRGLDWLVV